jgi:hypothetical protein
MYQLVILLAPLALLFTPFRRCVLIGPLLLAAAIGGYMANMALWEATGGKIQEGTDMSFDVHAGTASAAFTPLWTLTVVSIVGAVIGLSYLLIRGSIRTNDRRMALATNAVGR